MVALLEVADILKVGFVEGVGLLHVDVLYIGVARCEGCGAGHHCYETIYLNIHSDITFSDGL